MKTPHKEPEQGENAITVASFVVFGFVGYVFLSVVASAVQDILAGSSLPTSSILAVLGGPYLLVTLALPPFEDKLSPRALVFTVSLLFVSGTLMAALSQYTLVRFAGMSLLAAGMGFMDVGFLAMTARFKEVTVRAFVAGSGSGLFFGAIYYLGECVATVLIHTESF